MIDLFKANYDGIMKAFWETNYMMIYSMLTVFFISLPLGIMLFAFSRDYLLKNSLCGSLSGGEQQKVAIAMALLQEPEVLLCDEISSALDTNSEKEIFALLNKLRTTTDISIVMISHSLSLLKNFCDRVVVIDDSTIKDIVVPNKNAKDDYDSNYYNYVKEFLLND